MFSSLRDQLLRDSVSRENLGRCCHSLFSTIVDCIDVIGGKSTVEENDTKGEIILQQYFIRP